MSGRRCHQRGGAGHERQPVSLRRARTKRRMNRTLADRVLALAGVVQAAALVNDVATGRGTDESSLHATLGSILKTDAADVPEVFGGVPGLGCDLQRLAGLLGDRHNPTDVVVLRYTLSLLQLQGK